MPKKAQLRPCKIFHPTSVTELHNAHTVCHREVLLKEPLRACQAEERGNFNTMFPCSLALDGDSRNIHSRIKLLLSSPAVKGQFMHIFSSLECCSSADGTWLVVLNVPKNYKTQQQCLFPEIMSRLLRMNTAQKEACISSWISDWLTKAR